MESAVLGAPKEFQFRMRPGDTGLLPTHWGLRTEAAMLKGSQAPVGAGAGREEKRVAVGRRKDEKMSAGR